MWFLVVVSLHMLGAPNVVSTIQVMKFTDEGSCQQTRAAIDTDGVLSACTTNESDATGFVTAMNCGRGKTQPVPGRGRSELIFTCEPSIRVRK